MVYKNGDPISVDQSEFLVAKYQPGKQALIDGEFEDSLKIEPFYYNKPHVEGLPNIIGRRILEPLDHHHIMLSPLPGFKDTYTIKLIFGPHKEVQKKQTDFMTFMDIRLIF